MPQTVAEVMSRKPLALQAETPLAEATKAMRARDVGDVLVLDDDVVRWVLTDRDISIRPVAEGRDPARTVLAEVSGDGVVTVSPRDPVDLALALMREHSLRRLPVVEDGRPVGIVSLRDIGARP